MNLPGYQFLPAPLWIIDILHVLTLTLHFLAMNFIVGGLLFVLFGRLDGGLRHPAARSIVRLLPSAMAAAITLGVAPLLFLQLTLPGLVYSAAIASGWFWLLIVAAALAGYYLLYSAAMAKPDAAPRIRLALAFAAFVYIAFVYSTVFSMAEHPSVVAALYAADPSGCSVNPEPGLYLPRWLHMLTGAVAVGSFFASWIAMKDEAAFARACRFFTVSMVAAMVLGVVYLMTLSDLMKPIMRGPAVWVMTVSVVLAFGALHTIKKRKPALTGSLLIASLLGMVVLRHQVRLLQLGPDLHPSRIPVRPQWDVFALFLVCFVLGLGLCAWMAVLFLRRPAAKADA